MDNLLSVENIKKKYGNGAIFNLSDRNFLWAPVIPTGSFNLDLALGVGGIPRGRITEIYGPEQSGKTTVCQHIIAQCQAMGGLAAFVDTEHVLDAAWAELCGVDVEKLYVAQPDFGEEALEIVEFMLNGDFDIIVVDSVAALLPKAELEGEMGDAHMALQARLMSQAMRKLAGKIQKSNAVLIFTNQLRMKIGQMWGNPEVTTGGRALPFYASIRIDLRRGQTIKEAGEVVGNKVKATIKKNKVAPPYKVAEFEVMYNEGISWLRELKDFGVDLGIIDKAGTWFTIGDGEKQRKHQGDKQIIDAIRNDKELLRQIENEVRLQYGLPLWVENETDN